LPPSAKRDDALLVMAWLATHPGSDANTLGRIITDGGTVQFVSNRGSRVAGELRRFGYVEARREGSRLLYTLTLAGRRALKG